MRWQALSLQERNRTVQDPAAFEKLVLPHLPAAYNLARWLVRDQALAEDILQDATLRALTGFAGFRGGNPRAWLLQIVRNAAYDALGRRRGEAVSAQDEAEMADPAADPEASLLDRERLDGLAAALARLPLELRECLILRELEELSYKEIAAVTGQPIGTVMSRLWRGRQALLREMT